MKYWTILLYIFLETQCKNWNDTFRIYLNVIGIKKRALIQAGMIFEMG